MKINKLIVPLNNSYYVNELPIHSTTLFGALANCYVKLYGENSFNDFLAIFEGNDAKISSVFPFIRTKEKDLLFFPRPLIPYRSKDRENTNINRKKLDSIKWVSMGVLTKLSEKIIKINGQLYHEFDYLNECDSLSDNFLILQDELSKNDKEEINNNLKIEENVKTNVLTNRIGLENNMPFKIKCYRFVNSNELSKKYSINMFFLEEWIEEDKKWIASKNLLIDEGLGGKKYIGGGHFIDITTTEFAIEKDENNEYGILCSAFIPSDVLCLDKIVYYDLGYDSGYITYFLPTKMKKSKLYYFKEGSVVKNGIKGSLIKQNYYNKKIVRYGKEYILPLGGKINEKV
ncbi:MAG: hypothetical protein XD76_0581 [candidate division TA06 bacterium 32_111]|uniref:CRISPR system Cms protein Csm4 n=1 Tax=candidate division WOR-3 bacterium TaxID=2052148 RepID=A0A348MLJ8_UNCW3|nr:MAG: hypothetical protein XD76_0581 [candidate division TA06 bacterium 32_111]HAF07924.1 type III-A CRISPR-associated RAMP protein Csm4 [candidate division WOR-3 bacterium]HCP16374.1 type III-A CRISPR-associated RAMP protein Csm4 [candidate division WOR-3 bacterium]